MGEALRQLAAARLRSLLRKHMLPQECAMANDARISWLRAMLRGFRCRCPRCGDRTLFSRYVAVAPQCTSCKLNLRHQRADDAPPYFAIFIAGHVVVPLLLLTEKLWMPPLWLHFAVWLPLTAMLAIWLLPRVKGATIGLQWAFAMHGFGEEPTSAEDPTEY
jgi:uncharacterized protein (DUF983 family)